MDVLKILFLIALAGVAATLCAGMYSLYRGGEFGRTWSNRLMRLRIVLQAVAVALLLLMLFTAQHR